MSLKAVTHGATFFVQLIINVFKLLFLLSTYTPSTIIAQQKKQRFFPPKQA